MGRGCRWIEEDQAGERALRDRSEGTLHDQGHHLYGGTGASQGCRGIEGNRELMTSYDLVIDRLLPTSSGGSLTLASGDGNTSGGAVTIELQC